MILFELSNFLWLEPWHPVERVLGVPGLELELQREVGAGHRLYHLAGDCTPVARRFDTDDVLFAVVDPDGPVLLWAEIHLTWRASRESDPQFPWVVAYDSIHEWAEGSMKADHADWAAPP
ncbi:MAG: hypothetical protein M3478_05600 [Planctomycetota bacterium]|nr:hypothetical protein [Planctomycetota bacterium]